MASCIIEELDPDQFRFDEDLEKMYHEHERRPKDLLATVFDFLDRKSPFFKDPNASKTLARLLRDVKNKGLQATGQPASRSAGERGNEVISKSAEQVSLPVWMLTSGKVPQFAVRCVKEVMQHGRCIAIRGSVRPEHHIMLAMPSTGLQGRSVPVTPPQAASESGPSSSAPTKDAAVEEQEKEEEKGLSESRHSSHSLAYIPVTRARWRHTSDTSWSTGTEQHKRQLLCLQSQMGAMAQTWTTTHGHRHSRMLSSLYQYRPAQRGAAVMYVISARHHVMQ